MHQKMPTAAVNAATAAYWKPYYVRGNRIDLTHLEPLEFKCATPDGNSRLVRTIFSPHVFTRSIEDGDPQTQVCFDRRIFCPFRYRDSQLLPPAILSLPSGKVFQTWEQRNYVFLVIEDAATASSYHVFFEMQKAGGKRNRHVALRVESAYRMDPSSYTPPTRPNSIRFPMLVQNIFLGRPVTFAPR